jgi:hypothetical protein
VVISFLEEGFAGANRWTGLVAELGQSKLYQKSNLVEFLINFAGGLQPRGANNKSSDGAICR